MIRPVLALALLLGGGAVLFATETENFGVRVLPVFGPMKIDGDITDWDLSGGIFACGDVEKQRDKYGLWFHAMYDAENLYLLARYNDLTPLNNPGDTKLEFGWGGDSIQVRVVTGYGTPQEQKGVLNCWKGRDGRDVVELDSPPRTKNSPKGEDMKPQGVQQAFQVTGTTGYTQEIAVPWKLLTSNGAAPQANDTIVLTIEPNYTLGANGRLSLKDIFRSGVSIDRVFTFQNKGIWGEAKLLPAGNVTPQPLRLSDGRQFPVRLERGMPVIDWAGLVKIRERPGFKPIQFTLPEEGYVSLVIKNPQGEIVRQLLTNEWRPKGENTIQWDGLTTFQWKTPGQPVEPGEYTWNAIYHAGIGLKWRGFASNSGIVPWDNGLGTNWGGDMAPPDSVATEGDYVLLGWHASEAGKAAVLCDLQGKPIWNHKRGGFGGAPFVGLDQGVAYIVDHAVIYKLKVKDATIAPWTGDNSGEMTVRQLLGDDDTIPETAQGMAVKNGKLYLSTSNYQFSRTDINDWRALLTQLAGMADGDPAKALWNTIAPTVRTRIEGWTKSTDSPDTLQAHGHEPDARDQVVAMLTTALNGPALGEAKQLTGAALLEANRKWLEAKFTALKKRTTGFVAVIEAESGKLLRKVPIAGAGDMAANTLGVYVLVDGKSLVFIDGQTGTVKPVLSDLPQANVIGLDAAGNMYIGSGSEQQVLVYAHDGKLLRSIGRKGGRARTGVWQGDGLFNISGIAVDRENKVWIGEALFTPQRFSTWDAESGKLLGEYFGPTHYGASGGAIFPADPNVMVGEACEWRLNPETGRALCVGVIDTELHSFTRFVKGSNGRDYLAALGPSYIGGGFGINNIKIFERTAPGEYHLRARILSRGPGQDGPRTEFWADRNGDEKVQPEEVQNHPTALGMGGYYLWSLFMNTDFTLYTGDALNQGKEGMFQIKATSFTPVGAPIYDLAGAKKISAATGSGGLSSLDNRLLLTGGGFEGYSLIDIEQNRKLWTFYDLWFGVHGSHRAPSAEPGLLRGTFGVVGSAKLPEPIGDIWALNSNLGEWHLLTRDGFYLSRLFQPDTIQFDFPREAKPGLQVNDIPGGMGMEDFGGSLQQSPDGKVYVQAGKTALWNMEVTGLDKIRTLAGGKVTITPQETAQANTLRESLLQEVAGTRLVEVRKASPTFTGNMNADFQGATFLEYKKTDDTLIRSAIAYDDKNLSLAWEVRDPTPWINSADAAEYMYARGDTVDFQIGTEATADPKRSEAVKGDLRLSIGQVKGKPVAVIYRKVALDASSKASHTFSSGIIREYVVESVKVLSDAQIQVKVDQPGKRYVVEAAIPLASLGLKIEPGMVLSGDIGATHSNPSGDDTRLRTYWSNQETGLVDDEVYELMLKPANWGQLKFQK